LGPEAKRRLAKVQYPFHSRAGKFNGDRAFP